MADNVMEVLSKGRYEENEKVSSTPITPEVPQSLSMPRLPSAEPYFTLNASHQYSSKTEDAITATISDAERNEGEKNVTGIKATSSNFENPESIEESSGTSPFTFYDWVKSKSDKNMTQLLKSYISVHYGLHSAGKRVDIRTDEEGDEREMVEKDDDTDEREDIESVSSDRVESRNSLPSDDSNYEHPIGFGNTSESSHCDNSPSELKSSSSLSGLKFSDLLTQQAYEKMLALDACLVKVTKKEREVKRERKRLRQKMQEEGITLALGMGSSSSGTLGGVSCVSPLFPTQPAESQEQMTASRDPPTWNDGTPASSCENKCSSSDGGVKKGKKSRRVDSQDWTSGVDFVRRNIELVSDAGALVKMTQAEKQRLRELLDDPNSEGEEEEGEENRREEQENDQGAGEADGTTGWIVNIPPRLPELADKPFTMDNAALQKLREIQSKLETLTSDGHVNATSCHSPRATPLPVTSLTSQLLSTSPGEDPAVDKERSSMDDKGCGPYDSPDIRSTCSKGDLRVSVHSMDSECGHQGKLSMPKLFEETASVVCDEGDVVLECVEKDEQRHDKVDDDCDYDEAGLGIHGREGAGKDDDVGVVCERDHGDILSGVDRVKSLRDEKWRELDGRSDYDNLVGGFSSFSGRGILARDCLSAEEREKINMVDEKLRQLQEESDVDYLSKKPLSNDLLKLLLDQCTAEEGRTLCD